MRHAGTLKLAALAALAMATLVTSPAVVRSQDNPPDSAPAIAQVEEAGGRVEHESSDPEKPVIAVNYATKPIGDEALSPLKQFPELTKLSLNNTKVTDAGLKQLEGLDSLEKLYLVDTQITDSGLEPLKSLKGLKVLSLVGTPITDKGLDALGAIESLETVFLAGTKVTDEGVKTLEEARPKLQIVR